MPAGAYQCQRDCYGEISLVHHDLQVDELIDFPGSVPASVVEEVKRFWTLGDRFARLGFLHRRGYLLYGKQGGGKSSLIHQIVAHVVAEGHVAFFCHNPFDFVAGVEQFRQVEPDRPIVCVFEDIDAIIEHFGDSVLLQWLDGASQIGKAVNIASTNYPEKLDRRVVSRPRRFDRVLRVESPCERMRSAYFARKMPELTPAELKSWVEASAGLPFAALAELVISVRCFDKPLAAAAEWLRTLDQHNPTSQDYADERPAAWNGAASAGAENGDQANADPANASATRVDATRAGDSAEHVCV